MDIRARDDDKKLVKSHEGDTNSRTEPADTTANPERVSPWDTRPQPDSGPSQRAAEADVEVEEPTSAWAEPPEGVEAPPVNGSNRGSQTADQTAEVAVDDSEREPADAHVPDISHPAGTAGSGATNAPEVSTPSEVTPDQPRVSGESSSPPVAAADGLDDRLAEHDPPRTKDPAAARIEQTETAPSGGTAAHDPMTEPASQTMCTEVPARQEITHESAGLRAHEAVDAAGDDSARVPAGARASNARESAPAADSDAPGSPKMTAPAEAALEQPQISRESVDDTDARKRRVPADAEISSEPTGDRPDLDAFYAAHTAREAELGELEATSPEVMAYNAVKEKLERDEILIPSTEQLLCELDNPVVSRDVGGLRRTFAGSDEVANATGIHELTVDLGISGRDAVPWIPGEGVPDAHDRQVSHPERESRERPQCVLTGNPAGIRQGDRVIHAELFAGTDRAGDATFLPRPAPDATPPSWADYAKTVGKTAGAETVKSLVSFGIATTAEAGLAGVELAKKSRAECTLPGDLWLADNVDSEITRVEFHFGDNYGDAVNKTSALIQAYAAEEPPWVSEEERDGLDTALDGLVVRADRNLKKGDRPPAEFGLLAFDAGRREWIADIIGRSDPFEAGRKVGRG